MTKPSLVNDDSGSCGPPAFTYQSVIQKLLLLLQDAIAEGTELARAKMQSRSTVL